MMNRHIILRFILLGLIATWGLTTCFAQDVQPVNSSDQVGQGDTASETDLTDEQVEQILQHEGIPLTIPKAASSNSIQASQDDPYYQQELSNYTLGKDDVVQITVARHPELSGQYIINNEGNVQYEFVGDINIIGMTKQEATDTISQALSKYVISPEVTVKIIGYNSKVVYVVGEVGRPGKIFMRGDTITVHEALVQAGLPLLSAKTAKSRLITPSSDGHPVQMPVNIHKLLYEGDLRENLVMKPGDTLYVPATVMAKVLRAIQPVTTPIGEAAGTGRTVSGF